MTSWPPVSMSAVRSIRPSSTGNRFSHWKAAVSFPPSPDSRSNAKPSLELAQNNFPSSLLVPSPRRGGLERGDEWQINLTFLPPPRRGEGGKREVVSHRILWGTRRARGHSCRRLEARAPRPRWLVGVVQPQVRPHRTAQSRRRTSRSRESTRGQMGCVGAACPRHSLPAAERTRKRPTEEQRQQAGQHQAKGRRVVLLSGSSKCRVGGAHQIAIGCDGHSPPSGKSDSSTDESPFWRATGLR